MKTNFLQITVRQASVLSSSASYFLPSLSTLSCWLQSRTVFVAGLLSLFLKSFPFLPACVGTPVIWSLSKCPLDFFPPLPFNYDSFHFPPWALTPAWSSSHPLPSPLFLPSKTGPNLLFLISPVKICQIAPQITQFHSRPCFLWASLSHQSP